MPVLGTRAAGTLEIVAAMVIAGTIGVFVVESGADPVTAVFFRCLFGAAALAAYCAARGFLTRSAITRRQLLIALAGGAFIVLNWVFLFAAYEKTSISIATVVYHTQPFYLVLFGALFLGEHLSRRAIGWVVVAFAGLVLVSGVASSEVSADAGYLLGIGYALLAALLYAGATIVAKSLHGVRPHIIALAQTAVGIVLLAPLASWSEVPRPGQGLWWLAGLGLIHTCVLYILLYSSYKKLPTTSIAVLSFIYPVVALLIDLVLYDVAITAVQAAGIAMIAAASGAVTFGRQRAREAPVPAALPARDR